NLPHDQELHLGSESAKARLQQQAPGLLAAAGHAAASQLHPVVAPYLPPRPLPLRHLRLLSDFGPHGRLRRGGERVAGPAVSQLAHHLGVAELRLLPQRLQHGPTCVLERARERSEHRCFLCVKDHHEHVLQLAFGCVL
ncbi:unnamed protein product, partial [Effrenium voratum]